MKIDTHEIAETITGTIYRGDLVNFLKQNNLIPASWEFCSILVEQRDKSDEIKFTSSRRSYSANSKTN